MNKIVSRCIFIVAFGVYVGTATNTPWVLSDNNSFLRDFVNHELLNVLGLFFAITLASSANLHLEFNKMEQDAGRRFLSKTRLRVRASISMIIGCFALAIFTVIVKPLVPQSEIFIAFVNGFALILVLFNVLILADLTRLVFKIAPIGDIDG